MFNIVTPFFKRAQYMIINLRRKYIDVNRLFVQIQAYQNARNWKRIKLLNS